MDPITIAMGLAQFAPQVLKWITGSDKAADAASAVVAVAQQVTSKGSGAEAFQALKADPALVLQFRQALAAQEADLDKAFLADTQDARKRDTDLAKLGQRNRRADAMLALAVVVIVLLVLLVWRDPGVNEYLKGIVTLVLGRFLGYLDNIYNFEFGTTRSSRAKDATIETLAGK